MGQAQTVITNIKNTESIWSVQQQQQQQQQQQPITWRQK
jgi:hypothetical protein